MKKEEEALRIEHIIENEVQRRVNEPKPVDDDKFEEEELLELVDMDEPEISIGAQDKEEENPYEDTEDDNESPKIQPSNKMRGWHLMSEYIDDKHNIFNRGKFIGIDHDKVPTSKKV